MDASNKEFIAINVNRLVLRIIISDTHLTSISTWKCFLEISLFLFYWDFITIISHSYISSFNKSILLKYFPPENVNTIEVTRNNKWPNLKILNRYLETISLNLLLKFLYFIVKIGRLDFNGSLYNEMVQVNCDNQRNQNEKAAAV